MTSTPDLLALFDGYLQSGGMAEGTRKLRASYLRRFLASHDAYTCTTQDVVTWLSEHPEWSASTRSSARSCLTTFFAWMRKMGHRADDPALDTLPIRVPQAPPRPCPETALADALSKATPRGRTAILLGAYAGLRRAEIAGLHADMIDTETMTLRVTGKGGKTRLVPIAAALAEEMRAAKDRGGWVFPGPYGEHLSPESIGRMVSPLLGEGLTTHTLRHRFATRVFSGSHNLRATQELLGHSSVATTQRYTMITDQERREAMSVLDVG